jgi:serine/threonine-protein kinase
MDRARWQRMREIVQSVGHLPPAGREPALREACGGDQSMFDDLRGLLEPGETSRPFEDLLAAALADAGEPVQEGRRVGPYQIVREIGRGGMGAVYLADRADGQFEQRVALKLIKPGLDSEQFLRRFREERQILARLQHPHIARLLDGGIDDAGRPYFALEYVEGEPIDGYCRTHGLTVDQRLRLFLDVCSAVMYAHANLVVHRDLKPAHVLVTNDRQIRLLDFGIAKLLDTEQPSTGLTQAGLRPLTPEYASPEQVRNQPVGTSTDVYSLGVILYELLTGARPYEIDSRSPIDIERVVCDTKPLKPSTRTSAPRLGGDLDVICLKALQKDPERRYGSVEALHEDVRRTLSGMPVRARPDSVAYRFRKFVSRHRAGTAMSAASVLALALFVGYHSWRLAAERDRAQLEAAKAEQVASFLRGLFAVADPSESKGRTVTARELLDEGATRIERELVDQPEVRASMMQVIGGVYSSLGMASDARPLLEQAVSEYRRLHGDLHEDVAGSETALAASLQDLGDFKAAEPLYRRALATRRLVHGEPHPKVSESLGHLAFLLETIGDPAGAEQLWREALAMNRRLYDVDDPRVAKVEAELAGLLRRQDRAAEAEPLLRAALAVQRRALGDRDLTVASTIRNLASLLRDRGSLDEAETLFREALAIRRAILGEAHPDVAIALNSYALLLDRKGDLEGAIRGYREFLAISEKIHQGRPHPDLAAGYSNLGAALRGRRQLDEAAAMYAESIRLVDQVLAPGHANRAHPRMGLGSVYIDESRFAQAEPLLREALSIRRAALPAGHRSIGDSLSELGVCLTGLRRFDEAQAVLEEAERLFVAAGGEDDDRTSRTRRRLAALDEASKESRHED